MERTKGETKSELSDGWFMPSSDISLYRSDQFKLQSDHLCSNGAPLRSFGHCCSLLRRSFAPWASAWSSGRGGRTSGWVLWRGDRTCGPAVYAAWRARSMERLAAKETIFEVVGSILGTVWTTFHLSLILSFHLRWILKLGLSKTSFKKVQFSSSALMRIHSS